MVAPEAVEEEEASKWGREKREVTEWKLSHGVQKLGFQCGIIQRMTLGNYYLLCISNNQERGPAILSPFKNDKYLWKQIM